MKKIYIYIFLFFFKNSICFCESNNPNGESNNEDLIIYFYNEYGYIIAGIIVGIIIATVLYANFGIYSNEKILQFALLHSGIVERATRNIVLYFFQCVQFPENIPPETREKIIEALIEKITELVITIIKSYLGG